MEKEEVRRRRQREIVGGKRDKREIKGKLNVKESGEERWKSWEKEKNARKMMSREREEEATR
jgi:hypothetical protein